MVAQIEEQRAQIEEQRVQIEEQRKVIADLKAELAQVQQQLEAEPDLLLQARLKARITDLRACSTFFEDMVACHEFWA